jgi:hypothetical protein
MTREELTALAAPTCQEDGCDAKVDYTEIPWRLGDDGEWRLGLSFLVCGAGHRVLVEPLP